MPATMSRMNPVIHFLLIGKHERRSSSPFFDYQWYEKCNTDVVMSGMDPYVHFACYGCAENRSPSPLFDPARYLAENPDVRASPYNAFQHFVMYGESEGRTTYHYVDTTIRKGNAAGEPEPIDYEKAIRELKPVRPRGAGIDVVIPVYRAKDETLSCIWHVLKSKNRASFSLTVIDDCSPEPELSQSLRRLAGAGYFTLIRNETNLGFVKSVNLGMQSAGRRDVILLNSDTEVYGDWIDRLQEQIYRDETYGTATPLTNSGTICSYPHFVRDNTIALEVPYEYLDRLAHENNASMKPIPIPTAVGFCMYIKRRTLDEVGYFDEEAFGTGYGEENDFCLRAQAAGWIDVLVPNVFVRHLGSTSFLDQKVERVRHASSVIGSRYPSYHRDVQRFIGSDPLRPARATLDEARLRRCKGRKNVLIITHTRGGGTEQQVQEEISRMARQGISVFQMRAHAGSRRYVLHAHADAPDLPNLPALSIADDVAEILDLWTELGISEIHVHHIADFGLSGAAHIGDLLEQSGRPWRYVIHDYLSICPRINLADASGLYCGEPDAEGCRQCLLRNRSEFGVRNVSSWRARQYRLLAGATEIIVPNADVSRRLRRYFPDLSITTIPHDDTRPPARPERRHRDKGEPLRIGAVGAISDIKGLPVLIACARHAKRHNLPLQFVIVGYTSDDAAAREAGIEITGPYSNAKVQEIISESRLDAIFLPSTCPETFSYTLSIAFVSGLEIFAFGIGAVEHRLDKLRYGCLLPLELAGRPAELCDALTSRLHGKERFRQAQASASCE